MIKRFESKKHVQQVQCTILDKNFHCRLENFD